jgi:hypothetical protein
VIAGSFAVMGGYWLGASMLILLGVQAPWQVYAMHALAACIAGALMVAHAPLRPWREPVLAGVLALTLAMLLSHDDSYAFGLLRDGGPPWYEQLAIVAGSGVFPALGGLVVRRIAPARTRTDLLLALSALAITGGVAMIAIATDGGILLAMLGVATGGFVTQAAIAPRRPGACGAGGLVFVLFALADQISGLLVVGLIISGPILILVGYTGARLAWWSLRRGDPPEGPDVPAQARIGWRRP